MSRAADHASFRVPPARAVLDSLAAGVLVLDDEQRIVDANARAAHVLGVGDLSGRRLTDLLPALPSAPPAVEGTPPPRRCRYVAPDGRTHSLGFQVSPLGGGGGTVVLFQDITERQRGLEERDQHLQLSVIAEVLPGLLHHLKNPLAAATTALEVLREEVPDPAIAGTLTSAIHELRRVRLALDGASIEQYSETGPEAPVDRAARPVLDAMLPRLLAKGVSLGSPALLPQVPVPAALVRAILFHLVENAADACRPGDRIEVDAELQEGGTALSLRVTDTGEGMADETLRRCRELFFTTRPNGSGLGLPLAERAVRRLGGSLEVDSAPGRGTRVTVRLPVHADDQGKRTRV